MKYTEKWSESLRKLCQENDAFYIPTGQLIGLLDEITRCHTELARMQQSARQTDVTAMFSGIPVVVSEFLPENTIMISGDLSEKAGWKRKVASITNLSSLPQPPELEE
jgi:hypothetical protein